MHLPSSLVLLLLPLTCSLLSAQPLTNKQEQEQEQAADNLVTLGATIQGAKSQSVLIGKEWTGQPTDLRNLKLLPMVKQLSFLNQTITDDGMQHIADMEQLESITLVRTSVTEKGLAFMKSFKSLNSVSLMYEEVTDKGVQHLMGIPSLTRIVLKGTQISEVGRRRLAISFGDKFVFHGGGLLGVEADPTVLVGGCPVRNVAKGSAAATSGIEAGDIIVAFGEDKVDRFGTLLKLIANKKGGEEISIRLKRNGETQTVTVMIGEWFDPKLRDGEAIEH